MSKVTAAQRKVLEQMAAGDTITRNHYMGWFQKESARFTKTHVTVKLNTLDALWRAGLVTELSKGPASTAYCVTETALAIVQAKEAAGEG